jgi:hypothetical protein
MVMALTRSSGGRGLDAFMSRQQVVAGAQAWPARAGGEEVGPQCGMRVPVTAPERQLRLDGFVPTPRTSRADAHDPLRPRLPSPHPAGTGER